MVTELTEAQKIAIIDAISTYDIKTLENYYAGNDEYVPVLQDSLEVADMQMSVEEALNVSADCFETWHDAPQGSTIADIFKASVRLLNETNK